MPPMKLLRFSYRFIRVVGSSPAEEPPQDAGVSRRPKRGVKYIKMRGFPHSSDPEEAVKGELWAGVTPSGRSPVTWAPMKGVLRAVKPRVEGLISSNIKPNETRTSF